MGQIVLTFNNLYAEQEVKCVLLCVFAQTCRNVAARSRSHCRTVTGTPSRLHRIPPSHPDLRCPKSLNYTSQASREEHLVKNVAG